MVSKAIARKGVRVRIPPRALLPGRDRAGRGSARRASNAPRMLEVISFIPTLCVLGLVLFGLAGYEPTAPAVLWTVAGAIMGGPVVVTLFGFVGWLLMVVAGTVARDRVRRESPPPDPRVILEPAMRGVPVRARARPGPPARGDAGARGSRPHPDRRGRHRRAARGAGGEHGRAARGRGRHRDRRLDAAPRARRRARHVVRGRPRAPRSRPREYLDARRPRRAGRPAPAGRRRGARRARGRAATTSASSTARRPATAPTSTRSSGCCGRAGC